MTCSLWKIGRPGRRRKAPDSSSVVVPTGRRLLDDLWLVLLIRVQTEVLHSQIERFSASDLGLRDGFLLMVILSADAWILQATNRELTVTRQGRPARVHQTGWLG